MNSKRELVVVVTLLVPKFFSQKLTFEKEMEMGVERYERNRDHSKWFIKEKENGYEAFQET